MKQIKRKGFCKKGEDKIASDSKLVLTLVCDSATLAELDGGRAELSLLKQNTGTNCITLRMALHCLCE